MSASSRVVDVESVLPDYRRWLFAVAWRLDRTGATVEDLAQEGWVAMWRAMSSYDPTKGSLPSWLTRAAELRMTEVAYRGRPWTGTPSHRGVRSVIDSPVLDPFENPDDVFDSVDVLDGVEVAYHRGEIARALDVLSPAQRRYVIARYWLGLDPSSRASGMKALCALVPEMRRGSSLWLGTARQRGARDRLSEALAHLSGID